MNRQMIVLGLVSIITLWITNSELEKKKARLVAVVLAATIMGVFLGLRTWYLADNVVYHTQFLRIGSNTLRQIIEEKPVNIALRYYFHIIYTYCGKNFQIALIGLAAFEMYCLGRIIYKYSSNIFLSFFTYIFLGFYYFLFSGLKQAAAMAFLLLAFMGVLENKPIKFLLFTVMAGLFHAPSFIFIIAYPWAKMKVGRNYFLVLLGVLILVLTFRHQIVTMLGDMYYEEREFVSNGSIGGRFLAMAAIIILSILVRRPTQADTDYYKTFNMMVMAALLQSFSIFGNNFTRLSDYYFQFSILFMPYVLTYRSAEQMKTTGFPILRITRQSYALVCLISCLLGSLYYFPYTYDDLFSIDNSPFFWEERMSPWGS